MTLRYVSNTGSDFNPGTQAQPFLTVGKGLSLSVAGDTLYLRQGTYFETLTSLPSGTSWASAFTLASFPGEIATLVNSSASAITLADNSNSRYIIIDRLVLAGPSGGSPTSTIYGIYLGTTTNHISITSCEIKNQPSSGCKAFGDHNEIRDCSIHDNYNHGVWIAGNTSIADNNTIQNNGGVGVYVFDQGSVSVSNNIVRNNRCYLNGLIYKTNNGSPNYFLATGIWLSSGTNNVAYNNIIAQQYGAAGLYIVTNATSCKAYNNTLYQNELQSIVIGGSATSTELKNNICYLNGNDTILDNGVGTGTTTATNLIAINPLFINPASFDFSLQSNSPCIDAGTSIELVTTAINGIGRPQGNSYDIGAYEYFLISPSCAVWWSFEEATGSTVADSSRLGNTGTFVNNPARITGVSGPYAIQFNGSSNYIENTTFTWAANQNITVAFWCNTPGGTNAAAFSIGFSNIPRASCHCPYGDNILYWDYGDWTVNGRISIDFTPYLNTWVHIALVAGGNFKGIYFNGVLATSSPSNDTPNVTLTALRVGKGVIANTNYFFPGALDDFQIYNARLSQNDILGIAHRNPPTRNVYTPAIRPILAF